MRRLGRVRTRGGLAADLMADRSWRVAGVPEELARGLERSFATWATGIDEGPADGWPGARTLEELARILGGEVAMDPPPPSEPGTVY